MIGHRFLRIRPDAQTAFPQTAYAGNGDPQELVPADRLRKIARHIDFEFIRPATQHLYSTNNGRPAVDPVMLFKRLFIGHLFGVRSERQLIREIQVNVAYRWFLDIGLTDKVPDASALSQNRRRRFAETEFLPYSTMSRVGYREYKPDSIRCKECPLRDQCTRSQNRVKVMVRHAWEEAKERMNQHC